MPDLRRSAVMVIRHEIELPMSPAAYVTGRGVNGEIVCHLYINATGVSVRGRGDRFLQDLSWEELVELVTDD